MSANSDIQLILPAAPVGDEPEPETEQPSPAVEGNPKRQEPPIVTALRVVDKTTMDPLGLGIDALTMAQERLLLDTNPVNYVVDRLLPARQVNVAVGDSGLGKTPWAYQLGLCVATGKPFLGYATKQTRVLYYDLENGLEERVRLNQTLCRYLGIPDSHEDFLKITLDGDGEPSPEKEIGRYKPGLVIVDTLRKWDGQAEDSNANMNAFLKRCEKLTRANDGCSMLLLHHIKKPVNDSFFGNRGYLEDTDTLEWLNKASGARSLINSTNTRIAFDKPRHNKEAALVLKAYVKTKGETGNIYVERIVDQHGEPIGYERMTGIRLLGNPEQEAAAAKLPNRFRFKDAEHIYGHKGNPTNEWLKKCEAAGIIRKISRADGYERLDVQEVGDVDEVSS